MMNIGNSLYQARKKKGLSQEEVAAKLGISRQTVSKWESDETLPDIRQSKHLALLYGVSLDTLIDFDVEVERIQEAIEQTREEVSQKIDWTKAWSKKYPILARYQQEVDSTYYAQALQDLLAQLQTQYGYDDLNAMLVLKDILAKVWKSNSK